MEKIIHRAESRGFLDHGWLKSAHTFSFGEYRNPERTRFGLLRVVNDDVIQPGKGFGTHPHDNMEIITVPISGCLRHEDSMGHQQIISSGEVQRMSAGTGLTHSEYNHSDTEPAQLLQVWVFPKRVDIEPSYAQKRFAAKDRINRIQLVVSPDGRNGSLTMNQDAFFSLADFSKDFETSYSLHIPTNGLYLFVIGGQVRVADETLKSRDGIGLIGFPKVPLRFLMEAQVLFMEVPMSRNSEG